VTDGGVEIVSVDDPVGVTEPGVKAAVAPDGNPEAMLRATGAAVPWVKVSPTEKVAVCPASTVTSDEAAEREKA